MSSVCRSAVSVEWYRRYADCVGLKLPEEQTCGWVRERNNRSMILEILLRFEIGLKLAGISELRLGFLRKGVTTENLYLVGKTPWLKDILASLAIISAKSILHCLSSNVGIKSSGEDLARIEVIFS